MFTLRIQRVEGSTCHVGKLLIASTPLLVKGGALPAKIDRCPNASAGVWPDHVENDPSAVATDLAAVELEKTVRPVGQGPMSTDGDSPHLPEREVPELGVEGSHWHPVAF